MGAGRAEIWGAGVVEFASMKHVRFDPVVE